MDEETKMNIDLWDCEEIKTRYISKTKELEEAEKRIEHMKRLCKVLEEKLSKFFSAHSENLKLNNKVNKLQKKLEVISKENESYARKLEETDKKNIVIEELQQLLKDKEQEYKQNLDKVRNEAKTSLLTLESRIMMKIKDECSRENSIVNEEIKKELIIKEKVIEALNISNLRLKDKLELKENQYKDLENNYLHLKCLSSQQDYIESDKTLMNKNIEEVLREIANVENPDSGIKISSRSDTQNDINSSILQSNEVKKEKEKENEKENVDYKKKNLFSREKPKNKRYYDIIEEIFVGKQEGGEEDSEEECSMKNVQKPFEIDIRENEIAIEVRTCKLGDLIEGNCNCSNADISIKSHK